MKSIFSILPVYKVQMPAGHMESIEQHNGETWVKYKTSEGRIFEDGSPACLQSSKPESGYFVLDVTEGWATVVDI